MSLRLQGVTLPSDSLVDVDDILQFPADSQSSGNPSNGNGYHDQALLCITDLEDCCGDPQRTRRGNWYYPDGNTVEFNSGGTTGQ